MYIYTYIDQQEFTFTRNRSNIRLSIERTNKSNTRKGPSQSVIVSESSFTYYRKLCWIFIIVSSINIVIRVNERK